MAKKSTFMMLRRGADPVATGYHAIIFTRGSEVWRLALHKVGRDWRVSDPASGAMVCTVRAWLKGCPVASGALPLAAAQAAALVDLDALVDRVGLDRFASVLENPKPF